MNQNIQIAIARLNGYLQGVAEFSGHIRDYSAEAYLLQRQDNGEHPDAILARHFAQQGALRFESSKRLDGGVKDLEQGIRPYLIRHILGLDGACKIETVVLTDRAKYLSFRIMDLVQDVLSDLKAIECVFELHGTMDAVSGNAVYFCIQTGSALLVLQFDNNQRE